MQQFPFVTRKLKSLLFNARDWKWPPPCELLRSVPVRNKTHRLKRFTNKDTLMLWKECLSE